MRGTPFLSVKISRANKKSSVSDELSTVNRTHAATYIYAAPAKIEGEMSKEKPTAGFAPRLISTLLVALAAVSISAPDMRAATLKAETAAAFNRYARAREAEMQQASRDGKFFIVDGLPSAQRDQIYSQLRQGQLYIQQMHTLENGIPIRIPSGRIEHWVGMGFIPGGTLAQTMAVFEDYDHHYEIYKPNVLRSKLLSHEGNLFKTYMRFNQNVVITVVVDVYFDNYTSSPDSTHAESMTHSTKIAEVVNPGSSNEYELSEANSHGYLWRLYTYWRLEEKDGGVYVQSESIALSRSLPRVIALFVNPFVKDLPRQNLSSLLIDTRTAVTKKVNALGQNGRR